MNYKKADTIMFNGKIITMDDEIPQVSAVAVCDKKIIALGGWDDVTSLSGEDTVLIDLKGKLVLPGFIESHAHPLYYAEHNLDINMMGETTTSLEGVLDAVLDATKKKPKGELIFGWGCDETKFKNGTIPLTRDLIDRVSPDHPVFLMGAIVKASLNSLALEKFGIDKNTPDPEVGEILRDENGDPNGIVTGPTIRNKIMPHLNYLGRDELLEAYATDIQEEFLSMGVTTTSDMAMRNYYFSIYQQLYHEDRLKVRLRCWPYARKDRNYPFDVYYDSVLKLGLRSGFGNDMLNFQGLKFGVDGSPEAKTAALSEPFPGEPDNFGALYHDFEELSADVVNAAKAGLRTSFHVIGDRAIDLVLQCQEKAAEEVDITKLRNRLEHANFPTEAQMERIKDLNIVISSAAGFIYTQGDSDINALGKERNHKAYPHKTYIEKGVRNCSHNDYPLCGPISPLMSIYCLVTRNTMAGNNFGKEECISVMDAIKGFTIDAAYSSFDEEILGSITVGKYADIIVLSDDILSVDQEKIKDTEVELTMLNGDVVHISRVRELRTDIINEALSDPPRPRRKSGKKRKK